MVREGGISRVDLNKASIEDLIKLPGIGLKRTIDVRTTRGRFTDITDPHRIDEFTKRSVDRILPFIGIVLIRRS